MSSWRTVQFSDKGRKGGGKNSIPKQGSIRAGGLQEAFSSTATSSSSTVETKSEASRTFPSVKKVKQLIARGREEICSDTAMMRVLSNSVENLVQNLCEGISSQLAIELLPVAFGIGSLCEGDATFISEVHAGRLPLPIEYAQLCTWLTFLDLLRKAVGPQLQRDGARFSFAYTAASPNTGPHGPSSGLVFDPVMTSVDDIVFASLGFHVLQQNTLGCIPEKFLTPCGDHNAKNGIKSAASESCPISAVVVPVVFLPHCPKQLGNNVIAGLVNHITKQPTPGIDFVTILGDDLSKIFRLRCSVQDQKSFQGLAVLVSQKAQTQIKPICIQLENEDAFVPNSFVDLNLILTRLSECSECLRGQDNASEDGSGGCRSSLLPIIPFT